MAVRAMSAKVGEHLSVVAFNKQTTHDTTQERLRMKTTCKTCNRGMQRYTLMKGKGKNRLKEFDMYKDCWFKSKSYGRNNRQGNHDQTTGELFDQLSDVNDTSSLSVVPEVIEAVDLVCPASSVVLDHHIFDGTGKEMESCRVKDTAVAGAVVVCQF